ncbi:MAG: universal stress protein [Arenicellales bacterium]|jgi:nucleotide-binding universal stress UspA family protein
MKKILVGVDLKATYVWLVVRAGDLARNIDARVDLLYVSHQESGKQQAERRRALEDLLARLGEEQRGEVMVMEGQPQDVLAGESDKYDILVVGPREPTGWRKLLEDAMAVQVIGRARCQVFIPRTEEPKTSFRRILLGLNLYRQETEAYVRAGASLAVAMNATLDIAFCERNPAHYVFEEAALQTIEEVRYAQHEQDEQKLRQLLDDIVPGPARGKAFLYEDAPGNGLVELSRDYDLVIVGTADVAKAGILLGSVAIHIVRRAHCDVLTLPQ